MINIFLWGTGERTKYYILMEYFSKCNIVGFISSHKEHDFYDGKKVYSIEELVKYQKDVDYIVIANEFYEEILIECQEKDIDMDKVIITDNIPLEPYKTYYKRVKNVSLDLYELLEKSPFILSKSNESDLIDISMLMKRGKYSIPTLLLLH